MPQDRYSIKVVREVGKFFEIPIDFDEYISTGHLALAHDGPIWCMR